MRRGRKLTVRLAVSLAILATALGDRPLPAQFERGVFRHEQLGFKVRVPSKWTVVPLEAREDWIVAKFLSDRSYVTSGKDWSWDHKPMMKIIVFTEDAKKLRLPKIESTGGNTFFVRAGSVPYQNYRDYLKRNLKGQGFFFNREKETTVNKIPCIKYEAKLHKSEYLKRRLVTWVFRGDGMDVAVEFDLLEDRYKNQIGIAERSLKSFRFFDREIVGGEATTAVDRGRARPSSRLWTKNWKAWEKRPADERFRLRKEVEEARFEAIRARTPEGWKVTRSPSFLVVSHTDGRYTKLCVDAAEAFRKWLDDTFGDLSDEYVRHGVLRICADADEYRAFRFTGSRETLRYSVSDDREAVTYRDSYNGTSGADMGFFLDDILQTYLYDKDPRLFRYTPAWLRWGLVRYARSAQIKGKRIVFKASDWEKQGVRQLVREDKLIDLRELMSLDDDEYLALIRKERRAGYQLGSLVRFLLGSGKRHPRLKGFFADYLTAVIEVGEQFDKKKALTTKTAETEEEEEEQARSVQAKLKERRKEVGRAINARTVDKWSDKDWKSLRKAYERSIK